MFDRAKLADLADLAMGETILAEDCDGKGVPIYSASTDDGPWNHSSRIARKLSRGTIVVGARGSIGFPRMPTAEMFGATQTTITVKSREGLVDPRFLFHTLRSVDFKALTSQQAIPMLTVGEFGAVSLPKPPLNEQGEIVEVLDTLDTIIRQTEAIIAKLKLVKQGLLHDLLTRGIDANDELRPPQSEAPHLYKASPLGWIPLAWDVCTINDLLSNDEPAMRSGPFGSALLKSELVEQGLPFLGIDNVHTERFVDEFSRFVTEEKFNELSRYAVRPSDLMITIMGTVGRCCLVPHDIGPALSSKHTWTISLDQTRYSPLLAMLQVNYAPWVLRQFSKDEQGGTMSAIRSETLRSLRLPTPPIEEQRELEARMTAISQRIDSEIQTAEKAKLLKSGLMDDLLTGRVRVTPLLNQEVST